MVAVQMTASRATGFPAKRSQTRIQAAFTFLPLTSRVPRRPQATAQAGFGQHQAVVADRDKIEY
jgi:hypothetical protein